MMTKKWLMKIAEAVENWPTMPKDDVGAIFVDTPAGCVEHILRTEIPTEDLAALRAALPTLTTDDFAAAAQQIREAAEALE